MNAPKRMYETWGRGGSVENGGTWELHRGPVRQAIEFKRGP
jgi:hypothetical protein